MNFECHITIALADAGYGEAIAAQLHWKTSQIERDPVLGKDSFFYLTTHDSDYMRLFGRMRQAVFTLENMGRKVLREKIELIMHDTKGQPVAASAPAPKRVIKVEARPKRNLKLKETAS